MIALFLLALLSTEPQTQPAAPVADVHKLVAQIDKLRAEVDSQKAEIDRLRVENARLKAIADTAQKHDAPTDEIAKAMAEHRVTPGMTLDQVKRSLNTSKLYLDAESGGLQQYRAWLDDGAAHGGETVCYLFSVTDGKVDAWRRQVFAARQPQAIRP